MGVDLETGEPAKYARLLVDIRFTGGEVILDFSEEAAAEANANDSSHSNLTASALSLSFSCKNPTIYLNSFRCALISVVSWGKGTEEGVLSLLLRPKGESASLEFGSTHKDLMTQSNVS